MSNSNTGLEAVRDFIPTHVRKAVYSSYVIVGIVIGAISAGFSFAGTTPSWVGIALAVMAYLAVPMAALAVANTVPVQAKGDPEAPVAGPDSDLPENTPVTIEPAQDANIASFDTHDH